MGEPALVYQKFPIPAIEFYGSCWNSYNGILLVYRQSSLCDSG
ncbi:hypothetical protein LEP1GSC192_2711 [Leptospira sp. B5-022]|nr:hypothetical protein LEP1GSC192_2711 [Leptospira sp. B5-022]